MSKVTIYSLEYSFPELEPVYCSMFSSNCYFVTCIQISQEAGKVVWYSQVRYSHLFQNFPQFMVIHTVKGLGMVSKAEVDVSLKLCCFFDDPEDVGNLISGPLPFLNSTWTSESLWFTFYWSLAWRILSSTLLAHEISAIVHYVNILWHCLSLGLEWKLIFFSSVVIAEFSKFAGILSAALSQHHLLGFGITKLEFHHLH